MQGRKPNQSNVTYLTPKDGVDVDARANDLAQALKPRDLSDAEAALWDQVAPELAKLDRLKAHYVVAIREYVRCILRMEELREVLRDKGEVYTTSGRNGEQHKTRPEVAQLNTTWSNWRNLTASFGLTPSDERGLAAGQGNLFDNPFDGLDQ